MSSNNVNSNLPEETFVSDPKMFGPSTAGPVAVSERLDQLILPMEQRGRMPMTKDKYLVREDPALIRWERELRKFLRQLSPMHGHRVAAVMVYEWATGVAVKDLMEQGGSASPDLKKLNLLLTQYFGAPGKKTYIANRPVNKVYRIPEGFRIKYRRPITLELYMEYQNGILNP